MVSLLENVILDSNPFSKFTLRLAGTMLAVKYNLAYFLEIKFF